MTRNLTRERTQNQARGAVGPWAHCSPALLALALAGCSHSPAYDLMGSLFPAWLVCIVVGIALAIAVRWLLLRLRIAIVYPVLVYPCLAALFTFALWLIFFS